MLLVRNIRLPLSCTERQAVQEALQKGLETAGIAGSLAVGILLVSTVFRVMNVRKRRLTSGRT